MSDSDNSAPILPSEKSEKEEEITLPKSVLKKLGIKYIPQDKPLSEKEQLRRQKLSEINKERHAKQRAEKERYEKEQLAKIQKQMSIKVRASKVKEQISKLDDESSSTDEETLNEYLEFKKFKAKKKQPIKKKEESDADDEEENKKVIERTKKATQVLEAVNKLDQTIQNLNGGYVNPYLAFMNSRK